MLRFKFILGLKFFELVSILFAIVPDYGNEYTTKKNKNWTSFKNFAPKLNLNHNLYMYWLPYSEEDKFATTNSICIFTLLHTRSG